MKKMLMMVLVVVITGCAHMGYRVGQPGFGLTDDYLTNMGCDVEEVTTKYKDLRQVLGGGRRYVPRTGMEMCEVFALVGRPTSIDRREYNGQRSYTFWYQSLDGYFTGMVQLEPKNGKYIVDYVSW